MEFMPSGPLTDEEIEARKARLKTLILLGKERGYLTHGEINDHLPDIQLDSDQMESIVITFNEWNIAVYEHTPDTEALLLSEESAALMVKMPRKRLRLLYPQSWILNLVGQQIL